MHEAAEPRLKWNTDVGVRLSSLVEVSRQPCRQMTSISFIFEINFDLVLYFR